MTLKNFIEKKMGEKSIRDENDYAEYQQGHKFATLIIKINDAIEIAYGIMRDMGIRDDDFEIEIEDETKTD